MVETIKHIYHCPFTGCEKEFDHKSKLVDHLNSHTNNRRYQCVVCKMRFVKISHIQRHVTQHCTTGKKVECPRCKQEFSTQGNLKRHEAICKYFECEACGMKFDTNKEYSRHVLSHKEIQVFTVLD